MTKSKTYIILLLIGTILLFYSIWEIKPVAVDINDFAGLVSHLPLFYWVGYILLIICSMGLYLDNDIKSDGIYLMCLIIIGLFLFGVPIFAEENARFAWSYYPAGETKQILKEGTLGNIYNYELITYRPWPANHLISAFIVDMTDIKMDDLIRFMPLFWTISVVLTMYGIGKLLKLPSNQCFLISFLVISSFWTMNYYYGPQSLAYILYLMFFASIAFVYRRYSKIDGTYDKIDGTYDKIDGTYDKIDGTYDKIDGTYDKIDGTYDKIGEKRDSIRDIIFMTLIFIAIVVTHMLTSMAIILSFILSSIFIKSFAKYRIKLAILFVGIFVGWNLYAAPSMFEHGIRDFIQEIVDGKVFNVFNSEKYSSGLVLIRQIIHYSRISYLGIYSISMVIAAMLYLKNRVKNENRELIKISFFWLIGSMVLLIFGYGTEIDDRVYMFSLLPMALIIIMTFNRKIVATLAVLLIAIHIPAHNGTESFDMTYPSDLEGSKFIASKVYGEESINYYFSPLIIYYNTKFSNSRGFEDSGYYNPSNSSLANSTYVVSSKQLNNYLVYNFGTDKTLDWINAGNVPVLLYNNGYYYIFKNRI